MSIAKNTASQGVYLYAHNTANDAPKTGDSANITGTISKDGGAAAALATTNPTEIGDGVYWQPLSQAETNADAIVIAWESSTSNIQIEPLICLTDRGAVAAEAKEATVAAVKAKTDNLPAAPAATSDIPTAVAIRTEMDANSTKLANLDAAISSRAAASALSTTDGKVDAIKAKTDNLPASPAAVGSAMTLTSGERTAMAAAMEAAIINELDGEAVMQAIANLIASDMTTTDLTVQAIAAAVRDAVLDRVLAGNHDTSGTPGAVLQSLVTDLGTLQTSVEAIDSVIGQPVGASIAADIAAIDAGTAPTADEIADAVWDEPVSEHADAGSAGAALSAAQSAGDPWATEIPGDYADGTAGQILGDNVEAIRNKTDTIGAAEVTYTAPVLASGDATIYAGQSHTGANALTWSIANWSGQSLAGNTAKLRIQSQAKYDRSAASRAAAAEYSATVTQTGTDVAVSVSLTDAQTSAITPGTYRGQVVATVSGEDTIVVDFTLTVGKALDAPSA